MSERLDAEIIKELRSKVEGLRKKNKSLKFDLETNELVHTATSNEYQNDLKNWETRYNKLSERTNTVEEELDGAQGVAYELKERFNFLLTALITPIIYNKYIPPLHVREFLLRHTVHTIDPQFLDSNEEYRNTDVRGLLE